MKSFRILLGKLTLKQASSQKALLAGPDFGEFVFLDSFNEIQSKQNYHISPSTGHVTALRIAMNSINKQSLLYMSEFATLDVTIIQFRSPQILPHMLGTFSFVLLQIYRNYGSYLSSSIYFPLPHCYTSAPISTFLQTQERHF